MIVEAKLVNGRLIDICGEPINLECESYVRKEGKSTFESIGNCGSRFYKKKSKYISVGVSLGLSDIRTYLLSKFTHIRLDSHTTNAEDIAKSEGLEEVLHSLPSIAKYEFTVSEFVGDCKDECEC